MRTLLILIILFFSSSGSADTKEFPCTKKYDHHFRKYSKRFFGVSFDWRWFKAQAITESNLKPRARSSQRAKGIMQLLPSTFRQMRKKHPKLSRNIYNPRWNIAAGIAYNRHLWDRWKNINLFQNRLCFTFASYNAGFSTIRRAQKICKRKNLDGTKWTSIEKIAHRVGSWNHQQTIAYVDKIHIIYTYIIRKNCRGIK
jgi:membrane-bound lytic murein transglycosylase MltF